MVQSPNITLSTHLRSTYRYIISIIKQPDSTPLRVTMVRMGDLNLLLCVVVMFDDVY